MPTTDRTTIKAAIQALTSTLRSNLVADPPTAVKPFRRVESAEGTGIEYARPFLVVALQKAQPIGVTNDDKLMLVTTSLKIVTDATSSDVHDAMLDTIGAVDDHLDTLVDTGVIEGAEGFDDRTWNVTHPRGTSGSRMVTAEAVQRFVVKIERSQNRVPAP